jgi:DNA modification methylase
MFRYCANGGFILDAPREHPTEKPLPLIRWCFSYFPKAQTILDPFMGSGTTLRAAKDLGRSAIGIETEEKYCEIAANRLRQEVLQFEVA